MIATRSLVLEKSNYESDLEGEQCHLFTKGDLGFGLGLLPGAVVPVIPITHSSTTTSPNNNSERNRQPRSRTKSKDDHTVAERCHSACSSQHMNTDDADSSSTYSHASGSNIIFNISKQQPPLGDELLKYGLSSVMSVLRRAQNQMNTQCSGDGKNDLCRSDEKAISVLEVASQVIIELQCELEAARSQLTSKYRAIKILQSQFAHAVMINKEHSKSIQKAGHLKTSLEQEVNCLQFDLSACKDCTMISQQMWAERFDRVCMENKGLETALHVYRDKLRTAQLEHFGLMRERDELLAMMDAKEHLQYDRHKSSINDTQSDHHSTAQELAVLGACLCRGSRPEPCGCAKVAARLKKENNLLQDELDQLRQNLEATTIMADSFRTAFDHQLDQNVLLSERITRVYQNERRPGVKTNSGMRKLQPMNENHQQQVSRISEESFGDDQGNANQREGIGFRSIGVQATQPLPDIISTLADLLNDKTEALVHQRMVAKMLAQKTQDLEKTMQQLNEYSKK